MPPAPIAIVPRHSALVAGRTGQTGIPQAARVLGLGQRRDFDGVTGVGSIETGGDAQWRQVLGVGANSWLAALGTFAVMKPGTTRTRDQDHSKDRDLANPPDGISHARRASGAAATALAASS